MKKLGLILVLLVGMLITGGTLWMYTFIQRPSPASQLTIFEVQPNQTFREIAHRLEDNGLITNAQKLSLFARLKGYATRVRIGEYEIPPHAKPEEILKILVSGHSIERPITIPEGYNRFEIADIVAKNKLGAREEFLKLTEDHVFIESLLGEKLSSLEGYLFPDTYRVTKYTGLKGFVKMMVQRFLDNYQELAPNPAVKFTRHQLVTFASIIEKETGSPEERGLISSVFHNRLQKKMRMQTDPTVIYGLLVAGKYKGNITKADLLTPNAYNTYTFTGLPLGPIANPGRESLRAAWHPAKSDYLFFVSQNNGTHVFSQNYDQHNKAVGKFQLDRQARQGKSWRDLSKKKTN